VEIYKKIQSGENIVLDECFVFNFDFNVSGLKKEELIKINNLSAKNSVFYNAGKFDCTNVHFWGEEVNFDSSIFICEEMLFNMAKFESSFFIMTNCLFNIKKIDFSNAMFNTKLVTFKNSIFTEGIKEFRYTNFGNSDVLFTNTDFGDGDITFLNSFFNNSDVSFKVARIGEGVKNFQYSKFNNCTISFERTDFGNGKIEFSKSEFGNSKVNFNRCVIGNSDVVFEESDMKSGKFTFKRVTKGKGEFDFSMVDFTDSEAIFDGTYFGDGSVTFNNSVFKVLSFRTCHMDHYFDLRIRFAEMLDLSDIIVRDIIDLKPYDVSVNINTINFEGIRLLGRIYLSWKDNKVADLITNQLNTNYASKSEQFRILKQNFNVTGQYDDEDKSYVMFRRYEAKARLYGEFKKNKVSIIWELPLYVFKKLVFDLMGLYATSPVRVLISVIIIWALFGFIYFLIYLFHVGLTMSSVGNPDHLGPLAQSFYHSAITFFTIGYGDVFPQGLSRLFSAIEGFMGVFMMSYFTVSFVRKVLR